MHTDDHRRGGLILSALVAVLMLVASVAGVGLDGVYPGPASTAAMFRGYDVVTLTVVVPVFVLALIGVRRRLLVAELVWIAILVYAAYTYAFYLFAADFNDLFLLHIGVFAGALFGLVWALPALDPPSMPGRFHPRTPVRFISGVLAALALGLGGMWVYAAARFAITGELPVGSDLVETDTVVHLGIALDLALLVPTYALAAVWLWRRVGWGYALAAVALIGGTLHQLTYIVALQFQAAADVPGSVSFDPAEPVIVMLYLVATAGLLLGAARGPDPSAADPGTASVCPNATDTHDPMPAAAPPSH
ncbi:hypothetical protein ACVBEQ_23330 [Nakamurella sp. GG22]